AFASVRPAGIDAQRLHLSWIRIDAESAVAHTERAILPGKFLQTIADVHVSARRAVLGAQDDVLTGVAVIVAVIAAVIAAAFPTATDRKSTRLNSSHGSISYAVFCLTKKTTK